MYAVGVCGLARLGAETIFGGSCMRLVDTSLCEQPENRTPVALLLVFFLWGEWCGGGARMRAVDTSLCERFKKKAL